MRLGPLLSKGCYLAYVGSKHPIALWVPDGRLSELRTGQAAQALRGHGHALVVRCTQTGAPLGWCTADDLGVSTSAEALFHGLAHLDFPGEEWAAKDGRP